MTKATKPISDEAVPVNEIKAPTVRSFRHFFKSILVVFLSIVCIGAGILIYQMHHRLDQFHPILPTKQNTLTLRQPMKSSLQSQNKPQTEKEPEKSVNEKQDIIPKTLHKSPSPVLIHPQKPVTSADRQTVNNDPKVSPPVFTLRDTLILRDHLTTGASCRNDLQTLLKSRVPGDKWNILVEKLTPICTTNDDITKELTLLFHRSKKRAMIAYYNQNNPWWLAYLKAVSLAVVEIRRINPETENPVDILSLAQNKLNQRNILECASLIQKLPREMERSFQAFLDKINDYQDALKEVDQLILLFEKKEG